MIHVAEPQWSELEPKLFSKSWTMCIDALSEVHWMTHFPLVRDMLVRLMMTKEIVQ